MEKITGTINIDNLFLTKNLQKIQNVSDFKELIQESLSEDTSVIIKTIMAGAIEMNVSDLHFEAEEKGSKLRMRIDGVLQEVSTFNTLQYKSIVSRIKLLSEMKLNVEKKPQDGRFTVLVEKDPIEQIEIRVSTLPSEYGETIVMRVLNPKNLINLEDLGLRKDLYKIFVEQTQKPNGMIVVTGPTGSGKTTTLYAFLKKMQSSEIKIITIEDPIEYHLGGISQTQVDPKKGYDFASGLRSIVRQDPDVILVGEIRDLETASIALQAALTGHLVLSTLHTNDASGTVARFIALGESPVNIAPAMNMVVAQRLIRKVCPKCGQSKIISKEEYDEMKKTLENITQAIEIPEFTENTKILYAKGCSYCNNTGYKGRIGLFETLIIDPETEDYILTSPSSSALEKFAINKGMTTMKQDGFIKILNGVTTFEEVKRVTG